MPVGVDVYTLMRTPTITRCSPVERSKTCTAVIVSNAADYVVRVVTSRRRRQLASLVFEFDDEAAEWRRWFNELRKFQGRMGHCNPVPLADGETFLLFNWCEAACMVD